MTAREEERREWFRDNAEEIIMAAQEGDAEALALVEKLGDWHQKRRVGIGGSEVAAVLGLDERHRPIAVYEDKIGEGRDLHDDEQRERMEWGHRLEPLIAAKYAERHADEGVVIGPFQPRRHHERPWHVYTLDRLVVVGPWSPPASAGDALPPPEQIARVLEIKSHGFRRRGEYGPQETEDVPLPIAAQVLWYVAGVGCNGGAHVAALFDTHQYQEFVLPRDEEAEAHVLERVERWWRRYVLTRTPPPADGSESFARYLRDRFRKTTGIYAEPTPEALAALERLRLAERVYRYVEARRELFRQEVERLLEDADGYNLPDGKLHYRLQRGRVNDGAVIAELAERLGIGPKQLEALREKHRYPDSRPLRLPQKWYRLEPPDEVVALLEPGPPRLGPAPQPPEGEKA